MREGGLWAQRWRERRGGKGGREEEEDEGEVCRIRRPCVRGVESAVAKEKIGECAVGD